MSGSARVTARRYRRRRSGRILFDAHLAGGDSGVDRLEGTAREESVAAAGNAPGDHQDDAEEEEPVADRERRRDAEDLLTGVGLARVRERTCRLDEEVAEQEGAERRADADDDEVPDRLRQ